MKNNYFVVSVNEGTKESPKRFAWCEPVSDGCNLLHYFDKFKGVEIVHHVDTKKAGEGLADFWNECYKNNGTALWN